MFALLGARETLHVCRKAPPESQGRGPQAKISLAISLPRSPCTEIRLGGGLPAHLGEGLKSNEQGEGGKTR